MRKSLFPLFVLVFTFALGNVAQAAAPDMANAAGKELQKELEAARAAKATPPSPTVTAVAPPGGSATATTMAAPATKPGAPATVAATPKAPLPSGGAKKAPRRITVMQCDGAAARKPGIAMVHGLPVWTSYKDSDTPKAAICKPGEAVVVVGNTNHKADQQCLDYNRGKAGSDPATWTATDGLYAIAANVTQISKEIRAWCVNTDDIITEDKFALLAKLAKELKNAQGIDWSAVRRLLEQAPNFATKDLVLKMIEDSLGPTKRLVALVAAKMERLETRVDNLEASSVNFDIGVAGNFTYPLGGGGALQLGLNVPFNFGQWFWRLDASVGGGKANGQVSPMFNAGTSFNRQLGGGRASIGVALDFNIFQWTDTKLATLGAGPRLEVRLSGPNYTKLSPEEIRDANGQVKAQLYWFVQATVGGAAVPNAATRSYDLGVGGGLKTGLMLRIGKRYPVRKNQAGEPVAVLDQPQASDLPIEADDGGSNPS